MSSKRDQVLFTILVEHFLFTLDSDVRNIFVTSILPNPNLSTKEKNEKLISLIPFRNLNQYQKFAFKLLKIPLFPLKAIDKSLRKTEPRDFNIRYKELSLSVQKFLYHRIFPNENRKLDYLLGILEFVACNDFDIHRPPIEEEEEDMINFPPEVKEGDEIIDFERELLRILSNRFVKLENHVKRAIRHIRKKRLGKDQFLAFLLLKKKKIGKFKIEDTFRSIESDRVFLLEAHPNNQPTTGPNKSSNLLPIGGDFLASEIRYNRLVKVIIESLIMKEMRKSLEVFRTDLILSMKKIFGKEFSTKYYCEKDEFDKGIILKNKKKVYDSDSSDSDLDSDLVEEFEEEEDEEFMSKDKKRALKYQYQKLEDFTNSLMNPFDDNSKFLDFFLSRFVLDHQIQEHNESAKLLQRKEELQRQLEEEEEEENEENEKENENERIKKKNNLGSLRLLKMEKELIIEEEEEPMEIMVRRIDRSDVASFPIRITSSTTVGEIKLKIKKKLQSQRSAMPLYLQKLEIVNDTSKRELKENYKTAEMEFVLGGSVFEVSSNFVTSIQKKKR